MRWIVTKLGRVMSQVRPSLDVFGGRRVRAKLQPSRRGDQVRVKMMLAALPLVCLLTACGSEEPGALAHADTDAPYMGAPDHDAGRTILPSGDSGIDASAAEDSPLRADSTTPDAQTESRSADAWSGKNADDHIGVGEVRVAGKRVRYEAFGEGPKTVVFVHGAICNRSVWCEISHNLAPDYRVITLDLPGHGNSDSYDAYPASLFADAVIEVIEATNVDKAWLVGHSFGVPVVRDVALSRPDLVSGIFMLDGFVVPVAGTELLGVALLETLRTPAWRDAAAIMTGTMIGPNTAKEIETRIRTMVAAGSQDLWVGVLEIAGTGAIRRDDVIDLPVKGWFVSGPSFPFGYEGYLRDRFPRIEIDFAPAGSGHFLMWEHPAEFERRLRAFLSGIEAP